ncbi:MAG: hypothetical protein CVU24_04945 [Betaproteobacteria bacterium HGW-Betaproteobacteria-18]|nr:MAG: hypothetical protein CVU24_04945 [Betaproteobacteria bacterium HGW-Betaproteobacteria-18]
MSHANNALGKPLTGWRLQIYTVIFEADTRAGRWFDQALIDVRILRLLRVFRVFKLTAYVSEYQALGHALRASMRKIMVFLTAALMIVLVMGTLAVPTGIVTAEKTYTRRSPVTTRTCQECLTEGHMPDANFCRHCGARLPVYARDTNAP